MRMSKDKIPLFQDTKTYQPNRMNCNFTEQKYNTMRTSVLAFTLAALAVSITACSKLHKEIKLVDEKNFKTTIDGKQVDLYTLETPDGLVMQTTNYGARIVSLWVPGKDGKYADVVFGHANLDEYVNYSGERFIGCTVGRYANRIANGKFTLDSITYNVPINNNGQSLHGGLKGLDQHVWYVDSVGESYIRYSYPSPDGDEGFPGTLNVKVAYTLTPDKEVKIEYTATTDKPTVVNLSNHSIFNLKGEGGGTINDHILTINADYITPVDSLLIPTGELMPVEGTPFDFRKPTAIGARVDEANRQLKNSRGYDHNWVLNKKEANKVELVASVYEPTSGRLMEVLTDQPGLQFYGGNFFDGNGKGTNGCSFKYREGFAMETQKFPDSPNHPKFPSTRLNPGETYTQTCIYKFSAK